MSKYDYKSNVIPVFLEKKGYEYIAKPENFTTQQINSSNQEFWFNITSYNHPLDLFNSYLEIDIQLRDNSDATTVLGNAVNCVPINNFILGLFAQAKLEISGIEESISHPYYASTFLKYITKSKDYKTSNGELEAWIPDGETVDTSENNLGREDRKKLFVTVNNTKESKVYLPLSDIFGFAKDYHKPLNKAPFKITFQRKSLEDSDKFSLHTEDDDEHEKGHIFIQDISLHLPINELNNVANERYLTQFNDKKEIDIVFNPNRVMTGILDNNGENSIYIGNSNSPVDLVCIGFTIENPIKYEVNGGIFNLADIKSFQLHYGEGMNYPSNKPMEINITKGFLQQVYKNYSDACLLFGNEPQMSYLEFKKSPFICVPMIKQDRDTVTSGARISMTINKTTNTNYRWYALILENNWYRGKLLSNGMDNFTKISWNKK